MSEPKEVWESLTLAERCHAWYWEMFDTIAEMEQAVNSYEKQNPTAYAAINKRRETVTKLVKGLEYFSLLIGVHEQGEAEKNLGDEPMVYAGYPSLDAYKRNLEKILSKLNK